jgi:hypothetical protein
MNNISSKIRVAVSNVQEREIANLSKKQFQEKYLIGRYDLFRRLKGMLSFNSVRENFGDFIRKLREGNYLVEDLFTCDSLKGMSIWDHDRDMFVAAENEPICDAKAKIYLIQDNNFLEALEIVDQLGYKTAELSWSLLATKHRQERANKQRTNFVDLIEAEYNRIMEGAE